MAVLGFDIDDTVADGNTYFVERLNEFFGKNIVADDVSGRLNEAYGVDQSTLDQYFYNLGEKIFTELAPIEGAAESINKFYEEGHKIVFITARPVTANESTKQWLHKHGFKYHDLIHSETKVEHCLDLGIKLFVDDYYKVIKAMDENGIQAVFVDAPKNRNILTNETIHRASNWKDIYDFIVKWNKINGAQGE